MYIFVLISTFAYNLFIKVPFFSSGWSHLTPNMQVCIIGEILKMPLDILQVISCGSVRMLLGSIMKTTTSVTG